MDPEILTVAIGLGLAVSLIFSELFGLAAGGLVVPGYFALYLNHPWLIFVTIGCAVVTFLVVHLLSSFVILYGKRRTVLIILVAYLLRITIDYGMQGVVMSVPGSEDTGLLIIGYIIPGLIAIWLDRQGVVETITTLISASVVVRMVLILIYGNALLS